MKRAVLFGLGLAIGAVVFAITAMLFWELSVWRPEDGLPALVMVGVNALVFGVFGIPGMLIFLTVSWALLRPFGAQRRGLLLGGLAGLLFIVVHGLMTAAGVDIPPRSLLFGLFPGKLMWLEFAEIWFVREYGFQLLGVQSLQPLVTVLAGMIGGKVFRRIAGRPPASL